MTLICGWCKYFRSEKCKKEEDEFTRPTEFSHICKDFEPKHLKPTTFVELEDGTLCEQVLNPKYPIPMFCCYDGEKFTYEYEIEGHRPVVKEDIGKNIIGAMVLFPTEPEEYGSIPELLNEIRQFIHDYVDIPETMEIIYSYYPLLTVLYDKFSAIYYVRFQGDFGSGKTQATLTLGYICYKPMIFLGDITPAPVFRLIEMFGGTLVCDEADIKGDYASEITKLYNAGAMKGGYVPRCNPNNPKRIDAYKAYSPKVLGTRFDFPDMALESRCITTLMQETDRDDIPDHLITPEFEERALHIRNKLLMFRFRNYHKVSYKNIESIRPKLSGLNRRLRQVMLPIFAVTPPEEQDKVLEFLREYNKQLIEARSMTLEGQILEKVAKLIKEGRTPVQLDELLLEINSELPNKEQITSQKLGRILKGLNIKTKKIWKGKKSYRIITNSEKELRKIFQKYGIPFQPFQPISRGQNIDKNEERSIFQYTFKNRIVSSRKRWKRQNGRLGVIYV